MPTYEYLCPRCGKFEERASISSPKRETCPTCETKVERMISAGAGFLFKGSGFYITDYRSSDYQKQAKSEMKPKEAVANQKKAGSEKSKDMTESPVKTEAKPKEAVASPSVATNPPVSPVVTEKKS